MPLSDTALLLMLDCTKGFNLLDRAWVRRCLRAAKVPLPLQNAIDAMMEGEAVLVLDGKEAGAAQLATGLPQGCPLSCFIYILCVDPLLKALEEMETEAGEPRTLLQRVC